MAKADPNYDLIGAIDTLAPGVVLQREIEDAVATAYASGGYAALNQVTLLAGLQIAPPAIATEANVPTLGVSFPVSLPIYPAGLPRFPDSNEASDGWTIASTDAAR